MYYAITVIVGFYQKYGRWIIRKFRERPILNTIIVVTAHFVFFGILMLLRPLIQIEVTAFIAAMAWFLMFGPFIFILNLTPPIFSVHDRWLVAEIMFVGLITFSILLTVGIYLMKVFSE